MGTDPKASKFSSKQSGGIGGDGRVSIRINRQKWTETMIKSICTNDINQIWTPSAWIYPIPKWVRPDVNNLSGCCNPKLIGFHAMNRLSDRVYKNCTMFRNDAESEQDGALWNVYSKSGQREHRDLEKYKANEAKRLKVLHDWKFSEFALDKKQSSSSSNGSVSGHNKQSSSSAGQNVKNLPRNSIRNVVQPQQKRSKVPYAVQQQGSSRSISSRV